MIEQERALWAAVYVAAMGKEVDCHEVATQAVREMRLAEKVIEAENRGEPPFKEGEAVEYINGRARGVVSRGPYWNGGEWCMHVTSEVDGKVQSFIPCMFYVRAGS